MADENEAGRSRWVLIGILMVGVAALVAIVVYLLLTPGPGGVAAESTTTSTLTPQTSVPPEPTTTTVPPTTTTTVPPVRVFTFSPTSDITVEESAPDEPQADDPELVADAGEGEVARALMAFDVEGLPADLTDMKATLRVTIVDSSDQEGTVSLADGEWDEATTWSNAPVPGEEVAVVPVLPEGSILELDVTSAIVADGRASLYVSAGSADDIEIASSESGDGPVLIITVGDLATGPPPLLLGAGDIASCDSEGDEATADLIESLIADRDDAIVFTVGDSVYESGTLEAYQTCYEPSWGRFLDVTRPAPGSRDYSVPSADGYFQYFGDRAGGEADGYYSYHHGAWRVFVLNSNCNRVGGCDPGSPQYEWFVSQLANTEALCTAAYWQRPLFSSGTEGTDSRVGPLFEAAAAGGVDVLINGNDHIYERFAPRDASGEGSDAGMRQFTVGTGGRSLDQLGPIAELSEFTHVDSFGVLVLELFAGSYEWAFISTVAGEIDTGSAACN
jgi:acid phosphatase type 7